MTPGAVFWLARELGETCVRGPKPCLALTSSPAAIFGVAPQPHCPSDTFVTYDDVTCVSAAVHSTHVLLSVDVALRRRPARAVTSAARRPVGRDQTWITSEPSGRAIADWVATQLAAVFP